MYPGGKNAGGAYQTIISQIPPHKIYIELFLGSGAVLRNKRPAMIDIGVDRDASIIDRFDYTAGGRDFKFYHETCFDFLMRCDSGVNYDEIVFPGLEDAFVYADPPYLMEIRHSVRPLYKYEFSRNNHVRLLTILKKLPCMVAVSGYESELYDVLLPSWRKVYYQQTDRAGHIRTEVLWCNYPQPTELHDYRYLGTDFIDRQRIKRKIQRHVDKLAALPPLERAAIVHALNRLPGK